MNLLSPLIVNDHISIATKDPGDQGVTLRTLVQYAEFLYTCPYHILRILCIILLGYS